MKKFFTIAAIALFTIVSCSEDNATPAVPTDNNPIGETILLKKVIEVHSPTFTQTMLYNYNNANQLENISYLSDGGHIDFTYNTDGLIVETKDYSGDNELQFKETFQYDSNGRLEVYKMYLYGMNDNDVYKKTFTYNADGTITSMRYTGNADMQTEWNATSIYTLSGGNIVHQTVSSPNTETQDYTMIYDSKNSPYKNIPEYGAVLLARGTDNCINNRLSTSSSFYTSSSIYEYNSDNYPISMVNSSTLQQNYSVQYFYE